jgi:hypothetical protein
MPKEGLRICPQVERPAQEAYALTALGTGHTGIGRSHCGTPISGAGAPACATGQGPQSRSEGLNNLAKFCRLVAGRLSCRPRLFPAIAGDLSGTGQPKRQRTWSLPIWAGSPGYWAIIFAAMTYYEQALKIARELGSAAGGNVHLRQLERIGLWTGRCIRSAQVGGKGAGASSRCQ